MPQNSIRSFFSPETPGWRRWALVGLAVFVIVDVVLIVWAIASTRAGSRDGADPVAPIPSEASTPSSTPTSTPTPTAAPPAAPPSRILAALDSDTAWRAAAGACPADKAAPELTTDGGASWKPTDANGPTGASAILGILPQTEDRTAMITLDASGCAPQFIETYVAGDNWASYPDRLASAWYVDPKDRATVHAPSGAHPAPCPTVVTLAARDDSTAAVLCSDHRLFRTTDSGGNWGTATTIPGAVAVDDAGSGFVVAVTGHAECVGIGILTLADGAAPAEFTGPLSGCYPSSPPQPGTVAISQAGNTVWLWVGDAFVRSVDGGASWQ